MGREYNFSAHISSFSTGPLFYLILDSRVKEREKLVKLQKMWALRKPVLDAHILLLQKRIQELEQEIDAIVMGKYIYRQID